QAGMGCLWQRELVVLGRHGQVWIDAAYPGGEPAPGRVDSAPAEQHDGTASASPVDQVRRDSGEHVRPHEDAGPPRYEREGVEDSEAWHRMVAELLDAGQDAAFPDWWPHDDSGYHIQRRDLDYLGLTEENFEWFVRREAPLGMTPELY